MCGLPIIFFGSGYGDGVPMLQYSAPVVKAAIDSVKVCHCDVVSLVSPRVIDADLRYRT